MAHETKSTYEVRAGDCLAVLATLPKKSVDLGLTDPPYFRVKDEEWDHQWKGRDALLEWLEQVVVQVARVLKDSGSLYLFCSPKLAAYTEVLVDKHLRVLNSITWAKPNAPGFDGWKQKMSKEALRKWYPHSERIIFAEKRVDFEAPLRDCRISAFGNLLKETRTRAGLSCAQVAAAIGAHGKVNRGGSVSNSETGRGIPTEAQYERLRRLVVLPNERVCPVLPDTSEALRYFGVSKHQEFTDIWSFQNVRPYKGKHPCEKPQDLLRHAIAASTRPGAIVLDAFAGSGSTGQAALALGCSFIGIELDPAWAAKSAARCEAVLRGHQRPA